MNDQNQQAPLIPPQISALPGISDLLKRTWQAYKERLEIFLGIMIFPLVVSLLFLIPSTILKTIPALGIFLFVVFWLGAMIISFWTQVSLLFAIRDREEKIGIRESFKRGWHKIISFIWISFLVGLITIGGFLLFIIPGIIFAVWFSLATYVLVSEDKKGMSALFRSKQWVKGNWGKVFWRFLVISVIVFFIYFIIVFPVSFLVSKGASDIINPIVSLFLAPFFVTYAFLIYEDLKRLKGEVSFEAPKKRNKD